MYHYFTGPFVLVRLKRSPHRAITFSGFNPNNGLTAFATSADFLPPYYNYQSQFGYPVESRGDPYTPSASSSDSSPSSDYTPDYQPNAEYTPTTDEDRKLIPSQNLTPPSEQAPNTAYNQNTFQPVKKPKKKPSQIEDDEDDDGEFTVKNMSTPGLSELQSKLGTRMKVNVDSLNFRTEPTTLTKIAYQSARPRPQHFDRGGIENLEAPEPRIGEVPLFTFKTRAK